jgi:hypothetical protein
MNGYKFFLHGEVDLEYRTISKEYFTENKRWIPIQDPITEYDENIKDEDLCRVKQGSNAWHLIRENQHISNVRVEGEMSEKINFGTSAISTITGMFLPRFYKFFEKKMFKTVKEAKREFYDAINSIKKNIDESSNINMEWGKKHEANGIFQILETYENIIIKECGIIHMKTEKDKTFNLLCSPDGKFEIMDDDGNVGQTGTVEIKALVPFRYDKEKKRYCYMRREPPTGVTFYYVPQTQFQLKAENCQSGFYAVYSFHETTIIRTNFDQEYYDLTLKVMQWVIDKWRGKDIEEISNDPFEDCEFYDKFMRHTKKLSTEKSSINKMSNDNMKKYYVKGHTEQLFFNHVEDPIDETKVKRGKKKKEPEKKKKINPLEKNKKITDYKMTKEKVKKDLAQKFIETSLKDEIIEINSDDETP